MPTATLAPQQGEDNDSFGNAVAADGDWIAVSSKNDDIPVKSGVPRANQGSVSLFRFDGVRWSDAITLTASNARAGDRFGADLAMSGDYLVVGAEFEGRLGPGAAPGSARFSGAAYVYRRSGEQWQEIAYLKALVPGENDVFGTSIAASGSLAAVGAPAEDGPTDSLELDTVRDAGVFFAFDLEGEADESASALPLWLLRAVLSAGSDAEE